MLGVDLVDEENADKILDPDKEMGDKDNEKSKSNKETKAEEEEEIPSWQDKPAVPEFPFDTSATSSRYVLFASSILQRCRSPYRFIGRRRCSLPQDAVSTCS